MSHNPTSQMLRGTKRILVFSLEYLPSVGGAEQAVKEITDRIPDIEFDMVTMRSRPEYAKLEKIGNVNIYRIETTKILFPFEAFFFARKLHAERSYNAIWSIMAAFAGFAALFFKMSFPGVPYLLTLQEGNPIATMRMKAVLVTPLLHKIFTRADKVQAISHYLADYAHIMGYKDKVEVVPNGVDFHRFKNAGRRVLDTSDIVLITTSRLEMKNAVGDVINALHFLPEEVRFVIAGTGTLESRLKEKVKKQNLEHRVIFLGHVPYEEIPKHLHEADIFVRPSLSEGFGNSFIEAMAAGLPVIATPVGGIIDFIEDEKTGLFCEVKNPESIARQVKRLMEDGILREKLVSNASEMVEEKYDWNLIARQMWKIFDTLLQ